MSDFSEYIFLLFPSYYRLDLCSVGSIYTVLRAKNSVEAMSDEYLDDFWRITRVPDEIQFLMYMYAISLYIRKVYDIGTRF